MSCNNMFPATWTNAAINKATALAPTTPALMDLIKASQSVDDDCLNIIQDSMGKRSSDGSLLYSFDSRQLLCWKKRILVPNNPSLRASILRLHHDDPLAGHYGSDKTSVLLHRHFYWDHMEEDIRTYCEECDVCQRVKVKRHKPYGLLMSLPRPERPWSEITMDFVTGLPECPSGLAGGVPFDAILVVVDRYTKMARYIPCHKTVDSPELAKLLWEQVFCLFGMPEGIVSDRGTVFTSQFWSALCYYLFIKQRLTTAFHPQSDGQTERQNQALEHYLRSYCNLHKNDWAGKLPFAEYVYNSARHSTTRTAPFQACYGYLPKLPWNPEVRVQGEVPAARQRTEQLEQERRKLVDIWDRAQNAREKYFNRGRLSRHYALHDWVMLSTKNIKLATGKLGPKFIGPFQVTKCIGQSAYRLELPSLYSRLHNVFHVELLEPYISRNGADPAAGRTMPELAEDDAQEEWEVESILDHDDTDRRRKTRKYLIKWKGWGDDHNTWLPAYPNLNNSGELLDTYDINHGLDSQASGVDFTVRKSRKIKAVGRPRGRPRKAV